MKFLFIKIIGWFVLVFPVAAFSATIVSHDNLIITAAAGSFSFKMYQNASATDYTDAWFTYDGTTIKCVSVAVDESSEWYVVQPGDAFSKAEISAGTFPPLVTDGPNLELIFGAPVNVGSGDFYLGGNTGQGGDFLHHMVDRSVFGWVHLKPVSGVITMVENVMSYDSPGIIVGTTTLVPEPPSWMLGLGAYILLIAISFSHSQRKLAMCLS